MSDVQAPLAVLDLRERVERYLEGLVLSRPPTKLLGEAMRYSLLAGGDRLRPVMALATADVLGRPPASVLPLAAAVEMIHVRALMRVDLPAIGGGDMRGGKPTAHVVFGQNVALLAGDALFAEAVTLIFRDQQGEPDRVLAATAALMQDVGVAGAAGGLYAESASTRDLGDDDLRRAYELKTDHLLAAAVRTVLILTGESGPAANALRRFGAAAGVLSQIVDDIRDAAGAPRAGDARRRGTCSYVGAFGLQRARELARSSHAHASAALAEVPANPAALQSLVDLILARQG